MKKRKTIQKAKEPDKTKFFPAISRKTQKEFYLEASKFLTDLTKLIFGGIILTNIVNFNINKTTTFVLSIIAATILSFLSFVLFLKGKE